MRVKRKRHSKESKTHLLGYILPKGERRKERYRLEWVWAPQGRVGNCLPENELCIIFDDSQGSI